jgi:hypothetical protein
MSYKNECLKLPKLDRRVSVDDWLLDGELDRIERARNGAGIARKPACDCAECLGSDGKRRSMPVYHSCEYTRERSKLVDEAWRIALEKVGPAKEGDIQSGYRLNAEFVCQMDRLAAPLLRQSSNGNGESENVSKGIGSDTKSRTAEFLAICQA